MILVSLLLPLLANVSATDEAQAHSVSQVAQQMRQLHTPDAIAPVVLPYLACLYAARGLPLLRGSDGAQVSYDESGNDCSAARRRARADALKLLEDKPLPDAALPDAFVEQTLLEMEQYVALLPVRDTHGAAAQAAVIGLPVTIEDEVQPAYNRYQDCLRTQLTDASVTPVTVFGLFQQALTICRSVRELAVHQAEGALTGKGWDITTRAKAAESTFAKADESWLAMGQQLRQALIARQDALPPRTGERKPR